MLFVCTLHFEQQGYRPWSQPHLQNIIHHQVLLTLSCLFSPSSEHSSLFLFLPLQPKPSSSSFAGIMAVAFIQSPWLYTHAVFFFFLLTYGIISFIHYAESFYFLFINISSFVMSVYLTLFFHNIPKHKSTITFSDIRLDIFRLLPVFLLQQPIMQGTFFFILIYIFEYFLYFQK